MHGESEKNHSRGYLPHVVKAGASYFVTFRLADSLPREVLRELEEELRHLETTPCNADNLSASPHQLDHQNTLEKEKRKRIELYLDKGMGKCWLKDPAVARVACSALQFFDGQRYILGEWVVMSNHVHAVLRPVNGWTLSRVLQGVKWTISKEANAILGKQGQRFWQPESFDRVIRNEREMLAVSRYIRRNPVKAGLCSREEDWPWGSAWNRRTVSQTTCLRV